jgi:hypothetical protein
MEHAWHTEVKGRQRRQKEFWLEILNAAGNNWRHGRERKTCAADGGHGEKGKKETRAGKGGNMRCWLGNDVRSAVSNRFIRKTTDAGAIKTGLCFIVYRDSLITILVLMPEPNVMEINEPREYIHNLWSFSFRPA